jgi:hypothetical protein
VSLSIFLLCTPSRRALRHTLRAFLMRHAVRRALRIRSSLTTLLLSELVHAPPPLKPGRGVWQTPTALFVDLPCRSIRRCFTQFVASLTPLFTVSCPATHLTGQSDASHCSSRPSPPDFSASCPSTLLAGLLVLASLRTSHQRQRSASHTTRIHRLEPAAALALARAPGPRPHLPPAPSCLGS